MVFYMLLQNEIAKEKVWITNAPDTAEANTAVSAIARALGINPIIAKLLYNRGYQDPTSATSFVKLENEMLRNPFDMADMMKVSVLGLVENYSYIVCPDCGKVIRPYGESHIEKLAENYGTNVLAQLPIDPELASLCDKGVIELFEGEYMERAADFIENKFNK